MMKYFIALFLPFYSFAAQGHVVYLTWQQKPDTTMTIHWISAANDTKSTVSFVEDGRNSWSERSGTHGYLPYGHREYLIHTVEIQQLQPNTKYHFRLGNQTPLYCFQTMPKEITESVQFVAGGDIFHENIEDVQKMNRVAAKASPRFAILGGDIAYSAQKDVSIPEDLQKWLKFLQIWEETMVTSDDVMVPILPTTSNEDTRGRYGQPKECAAFFYTLFSFPGNQGYNVLDFGNYMSIWSLDSGHTNPIYGNQANWLKRTLKERYSVPFKFAAYHVPAFPCVRDHHLKYPSLIRKHWVPTFDRYYLTAAFEHHEHAYKRTKPIRYNQFDPQGTVYLGDGGWGVRTARTPVNINERWYLAKTASIPHFHLITITSKGWKQQAIDSEGNVFDTLTSLPRQ